MKPVVKYQKPVRIEVGEQATVVAVDHPNFPANMLVHTSTVIRYEADGTFETKNTVYVLDKPSSDKLHPLNPQSEVYKDGGWFREEGYEKHFAPVGRD